MAKRGSKGSSDGDLEPPSPAITEALRNVVEASDDDDLADDVQAAGTAQTEIDAAGTLQGSPDALVEDLLTPEELAARLEDSEPGLEDAGPPGIPSPTTGAASLGSPLEALADRLGGTTPFAAGAVDEAGAATGSKYGGREGMFAAGETVQTFPSAPIATTTGEGEVKDVTAGEASRTREALSNLPFVGDDIAEALDSTAKGGSTYRGLLEEAADSDPTVGSGASGSGGTGSSGADSGSGSSGGSTTGGSTALVSEEYDNADGSHTTVYESGEIITTYPDGTQETNYPDGTVETDYPDGTLKTENVDGSTETIHPDGTVETTEATPPPESDSDESDADESDSDEADPDDSESSGTDSPSTESSQTDDVAPLPEFFQQQIAADLAAARAQLQPVDPGDGVTDPNPDADPAFGAGIVGVAVPDAHGELESLLGNPTGVEGPTFGGGSSGGDPGSLPDSGVIDPSPDADTGVQTSGPEERDTTHDVAGLVPPPTGSSDPADDSIGDSTDAGIHTIASLSPLRPVIDTDDLAGFADAEDDSSEDATDDVDG